MYPHTHVNAYFKFPTGANTSFAVKQNKITNKHANLFWAIKTDLTQKSCHFRVFPKYTLFLQCLILRTLMTFCVHMLSIFFMKKLRWILFGCVGFLECQYNNIMMCLNEIKVKSSLFQLVQN